MSMLRFNEQFTAMKEIKKIDNIRTPLCTEKCYCIADSETKYSLYITENGIEIQPFKGYFLTFYNYDECFDFLKRLEVIKQSQEFNIQLQIKEIPM